MNYRLFFVISLALAAFAGKAPAIGAEASFPYGGTLFLSMPTDPKTFNFIMSQETSSSAILEFIFEGLTGTDPQTGEVIPGLAREWQVSEAGRVWTFRLRDDVVWSDGVPFTAEDVRFTFEDVIYNPKVLTGLKSVFLIQGEPIVLEILGPYEIKFILPSPFAPFLRAMGQPILPRHRLLQAIEQGLFNETWGIGSDPSEIVGTGPFRLSRYRSGESLVLERNLHYWKRDASGQALPYLDKLVFQIIPNDELALLKFKNGELDVYSLRGVDYPWLKPLEGERFTLYELGAGLGTFFLTFNQNLGVNPFTGEPFVEPYKVRWFTNRLFRQAVAHSIDRGQMIQTAFQGQGEEQHAAVSAASGYFHNPEVKKYLYDLDRARELLTEAGYQDVDGDGILEDDLGKKIQFTLITAASSDQQVQIANLLRKDLTQLGLKVNLQQVEFNTLVNKLTATFDWEAVLIGLTGSLDPHFGANVWLSTGPLHVWFPGQREPATDWERRIDAIFQEAVSVLDAAKRKMLYDEWQSLVAGEVPVIYTAIPDRFVAVANHLGNIRPTRFGGVLHNVEEIYIQKPEDGGEPLASPVAGGDV